MERSERLGNENIGRLLFKLSLPSTVAMMVNALYNLVDTIFVGQGVGKDAIGGLAIAFPIQTIIMAFSLMVGIGTASSVSRALGERDKDKANCFASTSYVLVTALSFTLMVIGLLFTDPILKAFGATETILPYARDYIRIIFMGSVFHSYAVSSNNLIRSEGNAFAAMIAMIIGAGMNIILDPIFIYGFGMGIKGAATATIISQMLSFAFILHYFYSGKSSLDVKPHHIRFKASHAREIIAVGLPTFLRNTVGSVVQIVLNHSLGYYGGDNAIIVYGLINRLTMFLLMPTFGIVHGLQPIIGYNYGARKFDRAKHAIRLALIIISIVLATASITVMIIPSVFIRMFTPNPDIMTLGVKFIRIFYMMVPVVGLQIVASTVYQSFGKAKPAAFISLLRQAILLIPLVLTLPLTGLGMWGIIAAFPIADLVSSLISGLMLRREIKLNLN